MGVIVSALVLAYGPVGAAHAADENRVPELTVSGSGIARRAPDVAVVTIGARAIEQTVEAAQSKVNTAINAAKASAAALGVPKAAIRTSGLDVTAMYERRDHVNTGDDLEKLPRLIGYRAETTLSILLDDVAIAGKVIDAAIKAGVTDLEGVRFGLKDDTEEQKQALTKAVVNARVKAETIAAALGVEIVGVLEVADESISSYGGGSSPFDGGDSTEVEPGEIVVEAEVGIRFQIAPIPRR